jgi:hypothetical protein
MRVCPRCEKSRRTFEHVERDKKTKKKYLITSCVMCKFNFDLEEVKGNEISKRL